MSNKLKPNKLTIGILMGGPSMEHEVSLDTGKNVIENLDKSKYELVAITISKKGDWFLNGKLTTEARAFKSCSLVFNALHGTFGEDGRVQALMEYYGVKYTGSGICGSALAMDKLRSREIFKLAGLQVPKTLKIRRGENYQALLSLFVTKVTNFPVVVKPCSGGSSVGVAIVASQSKLEKAIKSVFEIDGKVLVEEFIEGKEVTCGVLDHFSVKDGSASGWNGGVGALPVTEIIPKKGHKFFNYMAKYKTGHSDEITPAFLDEEVAKRIQEIAVRTHQLLGCRAYSRTDMIIKVNSPFDNAQGQNIYVLETNTLPGLTVNSLLPKAAQVAGLTFPKLLDKIIQSSLT